MKNKAKNGNEIKHGVELNKKGVHTAFYVETLENGRIKSKRIPATGEKSGRKIAWLIYGTDKKLDDVRGEPLLSLVLYMLKEINRAMDSEQRAATINAMLPLFIKKGEKVVGSNPWNGGASARGDVEVTDHTTSTTSARKIIGGVPGQVFDELAHGEEPVSFNTQRPSASFGKFEEIILNTVAWSQELPPEILRLMFTNSFSASRQANNEFNIYLKKEFKKFGNNFYQPIYKERLISTVLLNQIEAKGLIEAWRDPKQWRIVGAWTNAIWMGLTRPSIDIKKDIDAMAKALEYGLVTGKFATNFLNGARYKDVMKQSDREKRLREKLDLHFKADEDNNGLPISEGGVITPEVQNNLMELLEEMKGRLEELEDKTEDMEV
jgi:capsid protein